MLRIAEEVLLLLLRSDGKLFHIRDRTLDRVVAGAVLVELAMENRIDTDLQQLMLVDPTPLGDELLDPTLARIGAEPAGRNARYWVESEAARAEDIRHAALGRLVERGYLRLEEDLILRRFRFHRYPTVDGRGEREVKLRIMNVLFSDSIPSPRDIAVIALLDSCDMFIEILPPAELRQSENRIGQVRRLDLIGQAVTQAVSEAGAWAVGAALRRLAQLALRTGAETGRRTSAPRRS